MVQQRFLVNGGSHSKNYDINAWAYAYRAEGEDYLVLPEFDYSANPSSEPVNVRLGAFDDRPAQDIGIAFTGKNWRARANYRRAHYIEPFSSAGQSGEAYRYQDFPLFKGVGPGVESSWLHINGYRSFSLDGSGELKLILHYDENRIVAPLVANPANQVIANVFWEEQSTGGKLEWSRQLETGNYLLGLQYEQMDLVESELSVYAAGALNSPPIEVLAIGKETTSSAYAQYKQKLNSQWLLNLGGRFDIKDRLTGNTIKEFSPRLAFIYNKGNYGLKLSYSRAFVDPLYWNRYSALASFRGSRDLEPEFLESLQISPEFVSKDKDLSVKLNLYYNQHSDFVFRNNAAAANDPIYTNAGEMATIGLEHEWQYQMQNHLIKLVASYYRVESVEFYEAQYDEIFNIPQTQYSVTWDWQLSEQVSNQLNYSSFGSRLSPILILNNGQPVTDPFPGEGSEFQLPNNRLPTAGLLNWKFNWKSSRWPLSVSASVQNLANKQWKQGVSTIHPYPQTGRWGQVELVFRW